MKISSDIAFQNMQQTNARRERIELATNERVLEERRNVKINLEKAVEAQRLAEKYSYAKVIRKTEGTVLDVEV
jgi:hypothetical protein